LVPEALAVIKRRKISALFLLLDDGAPVGFLLIHDCLRAGIA